MDWKDYSGILRRINWIVLVVLSSLSFFIMSPSTTLGVILGGLIIIANFNVMQRTISRAFSPQGVLHSGKGSIIAKYYLRLLALGFILFLMISKGIVDPIGLGAGLSTVVLSIVVLGVIMAVKSMTGETT